MKEPKPARVATETSVAALGTAAQAGQAATDPVVIGAAEVPVEPGGPGVGAARTAEVEEVAVSRPLTDAAEADLGLRPAAGITDDALSASERAELLELRRLRGAGGLVVDAAEIPGERLALAAAPILRNGVNYAIGDYVPVDFGSYTELGQIGAITGHAWNNLPDAG